MWRAGKGVWAGRKECHCCLLSDSLPSSGNPHFLISGSTSPIRLRCWNLLVHHQQTGWSSLTFPLSLCLYHLPFFSSSDPNISSSSVPLESQTRNTSWMTRCFEPVPIDTTILQRQSSKFTLVCFFLFIFIPIPKSSASQPVDQLTLSQGLSLW